MNRRQNIGRAKCIKSIKYVWKHFLEPLSPDSLSDCPEGRFLVYNCRNNDIHPCGGLGDRERGIISYFLLALQTGRTFAIDVDKPCELEQFLLPNLYNWSRCKTYIRSLPANETRVIRLQKPRRKHYFKLFQEPASSNLSACPNVVHIYTNIAPLKGYYQQTIFKKVFPG